MITFEQARRAGIDACIDRLGREFVTKHRETACSAYGDRGDYVYCFVGVSDKPYEKVYDGLVLDGGSKFPFVARCTVSYVDGSIDYLDSVLPSAEESGI